FSFFHWGLHPWAVYAVLGLALAYFKFRKQSSGLISAILEPLFGDRMKGSLGTLIDFIAIFATVFGVATSLGLGASQITGGISYIFGTNPTFLAQLIIFLLFLGPTTYIMKFFTTTLGTYIQNLPSMSLRMTPFNEGNSDWIKDWTIFYWAWWIAWAPFVGTFIARVSRGRTIKEFVSGVLLVPTIFGALWFTVFG